MIYRQEAAGIIYCMVRPPPDDTYWTAEQWYRRYGDDCRKGEAKAKEAIRQFGQPGIVYEHDDHVEIHVYGETLSKRITPRKVL